MNLFAFSRFSALFDLARLHFVILNAYD